MRAYLNRIGFIGEEYKNYREHLYKFILKDYKLEFRVVANIIKCEGAEVPLRKALKESYKE